MAGVVLKVVHGFRIRKASHKDDAKADESRQNDGLYTGFTFGSGCIYCVHNNISFTVFPDDWLRLMQWPVSWLVVLCAPPSRGLAQWHCGTQTHLQSRGRLLHRGLIWSPLSAFPFHPRAFSHIGEPLPFQRCTLFNIKSIGFSVGRPSKTSPTHCFSQLCCVLLWP